MSDRPSTDPSIPGVVVGTSPAFGDERGSFREVWRHSTLDPAGLAPLAEAAFVQANLSISAAGVLRGMHLHRRQLDLWFVASGRAFTALVDVRPMLAGGPRPIVKTLDLAADDWVAIPAGVAHGFLAREPVRLLYLVTNEYDGSDELGFAWDDHQAAVPWPRVSETPDARPILSDRDRSNPPLADLVARLRDAAP